MRMVEVTCRICGQAFRKEEEYHQFIRFSRREVINGESVDSFIICKRDINLILHHLHELNSKIPVVKEHSLWLKKEAVLLDKARAEVRLPRRDAERR